MRARLFIVVLLAGLIYQPAKAEVVDPGLIAALQQATRDIEEQTTDLDSLVWLSSMSEKLERRIRNPFYRVRLLKAIHAEATRAGLDPQLVLAVIDIESNFNRFAESHAGAEGLMQVMPFWKDVYGERHDDFFNPLVSLRYGCTILRYYLDRYKSTARGLAAYNGSLGRKTYSSKVLKRLAQEWQFKHNAGAIDEDTELANR